ncbi:hypothetical protein ACFL35_01065 [Candidatus Riflebacteria bacterium]
MSNKDKISYLHGQPKSSIPDYYADAVQIKMAPYGFKFTCGLIGETPTEVEEVVNIRVSPQLAKVFAHLLGKQIEIYENSIGPISLPKGLLQDLAPKI